jgi:hypothetical protein
VRRAYLATGPCAGPARREFRIAAAAILALTVTAASYPCGLLGLTEDALRASGLTGQPLTPLKARAFAHR